MYCNLKNKKYRNFLFYFLKNIQKKIYMYFDHILYLIFYNLVLLELKLT